MRIGQFAEKYKVTQDTIRYYISLSLLFPEKIHNQYYFDEKCEKDMEEILELRNLKFSISEIQKMISVKRLRTLINFNEKKIIEEFLNYKKESLQNEIDNAMNSLKIIEEKLNILNKENVENEKIELGLPLSFVNLTACPYCKQELSLSANNIKNNQIYEGFLKCEKCDKVFEIDNGIIKTEDIDCSPISTDYVLERDFDKESTPFLVSALDKTRTDFRKKILKDKVDGKVILELVSRRGTLFHSLEQILLKKKYYIICGLNINFVKSFKSFLETKNVSNVILIAGNFEKLPIKNNQIDITVDILSSNEFLSNNNNIPVENISSLLKDNGKWHTLFLYFDKSSKNFKNSGEKKKYLDFDSLKKEYEKNGFKILESKKMGEIIEKLNQVQGVSNDEKYNLGILECIKKGSDSNY